jgi:hypothetical protein
VTNTSATTAISEEDVQDLRWPDEGHGQQAGPWQLILKHAQPLALAGLLTLTPNVSPTGTIGPASPQHLEFRSDSGTLRPSTRTSRGWAFAQRVSDAARVAAPPPGVDEDDEYQVEPPDPAIWEHAPATSWI